jgi:hypothetical protein
MIKRILLVIAGAFFFAFGFGPALIGAAIGMITLGWVAGILHLVLILLGGALLIVGLRRERPPGELTTKKGLLIVIAGIGGVLLIATGALILVTGRYPFAGYLDIVAGIGFILAMVHGKLKKPPQAPGGKG